LGHLLIARAGRGDIVGGFVVASLGPGKVDPAAYPSKFSRMAE